MPGPKRKAPATPRQQERTYAPRGDRARPSVFADEYQRLAHDVLDDTLAQLDAVSSALHRAGADNLAEVVTEAGMRLHRLANAVINYHSTRLKL